MSNLEPPPASIYFRQTCTFVSPEQQEWNLQYSKLHKEGIVEETINFYQSMGKHAEGTRFHGIAVNNGDRVGYSTKVRRFVSEEFCRQAAIQNQLGKPVDLDFVIAEAYRCHPDLEEAQVKSGKKALQVEQWKKMLAFVWRLKNNDM